MAHFLITSASIADRHTEPERSQLDPNYFEKLKQEKIKIIIELEGSGNTRTIQEEHILSEILTRLNTIY